MKTYSWIFLSVAEQPKPTSLQTIIGVADYINHAIPTQNELQTSLGWLQAQGLIKKEGDNYLLTETGSVLRKSVSRKRSIHELWDAIEAKISEMPKIAFQPENISAAEIHAAYEDYVKGTAKRNSRK